MSTGDGEPEPPTNTEADWRQAVPRRARSQQAPSPRVANDKEPLDGAPGQLEYDLSRWALEPLRVKW